MADDDVTGTNTDTATPTDAAGQKNSVANQESKKETRTPETAESGNSTTQLWKQEFSEWAKKTRSSFQTTWDTTKSKAKSYLDSTKSFGDKSRTAMSNTWDFAKTTANSAWSKASSFTSETWEKIKCAFEWAVEGRKKPRPAADTGTDATATNDADSKARHESSGETEAKSAEPSTRGDNSDIKKTDAESNTKEGNDSS